MTYESKELKQQKELLEAWIRLQEEARTFAILYTKKLNKERERI